jgi:ribosome-binding factor A
MTRRIDRVNELLRQEISQVLARQVKDPRLSGVISITRVETSSDLRGAQVFLTVMGDSAAKENALEGIRSAATFLRRELRQRLAMRHTPFLKFFLDQSFEEADHLLGIMDRLRDQQTGRAPEDEGDRDGGPLTSPASDG